MDGEQACAVAKQVHMSNDLSANRSKFHPQFHPR